LCVKCPQLEMLSSRDLGYHSLFIFRYREAREAHKKAEESSVLSLSVSKLFIVSKTGYQRFVV